VHVTVGDARGVDDAALVCTRISPKAGYHTEVECRPSPYGARDCKAGNLSQLNVYFGLL
jgi:hypothetical protein